MVFPAFDSAALRRAADALRAGQVLAFPTDTVYGIGADVLSTAGIARIYALKGRATEKAIPILISDFEQLDRVAAEVPPSAARLIQAFWPGALTVVLPRHARVPGEIAPGKDSIGIRMPAHPIVRKLIGLAGGPIACSSANLSGMPAAESAAAVAEQFPTGLALILDGGPSNSGVPSTV
ncbi:MAG: putative translation factor, partial [Chloroflexi bacterium]|nr:putative translation factor [Chloroflexota bacterium]